MRRKLLAILVGGLAIIAGLLLLRRVGIIELPGLPPLANEQQQQRRHATGTSSVNAGERPNGPTAPQSSQAKQQKKAGGRSPRSHVTNDETTAPIATATTTQSVASAPETTAPMEVADDVGPLLKGMVVDLENDPIAGARVELLLRNSSTTHTRLLASTTSDTSGTFSLKGLADADLVLSATKVLVGSSLPRSLPRNPAALKRPFILVLRDQETATRAAANADKVQPASCTLIGRVVDDTSHRAISGFQVKQHSGGTLTIAANASGEFLLADLKPASSYEVYLEASGYAPLKQQFSVPPSEETFEREFEMNRGGSIIGRFVSRADKSPVANVKVRLWPASYSYGQQLSDQAQTVSGTDGTFRLDQVPPILNTALVDPPAPFSPIRLVKLAPSVNAIKNLGDIELSDGAAIKGSLIGSEGEPLAAMPVNLSIWRNGERRSATTDAEGHFEFKAVPNSEWVHVSAPQQKVETTVQLQPDETREVELRVGSGTLSGNVLLRGQPTAAYLALSMGDPNLPDYRWKTLATGANGSYTISGLIAGTWLVQATSPVNTHQYVREYVTIPDTLEPVEQNFELPGASIRGKITDGQDQPVYAARVFATVNWQDAESPLTRRTDVSSVTNSDGEFVIDGLLPGQFSLSVVHDICGSAFEPNVVISVEDETREVNLRLKKAGTGILISTALDMQGNPIQVASCLLVSSDGTPFAYPTIRDNRGVLEIRDIPAGAYQVQISAPDHARRMHTVTIDTDETVLLDDVLDPGGSLQWTLKTPAGLPVAGVPCSTRAMDPNSIEAPREGRTDSYGVLLESGLLPGVYTVTALPPSHPLVSEQFTVTSSGFFGPGDCKQTILNLKE